MDEREFYVVPENWPVTIRCHKCGRVLGPGDRYFMTDDDSWLYCETCASGRERPRGPRQVVPEPEEREPLHLEKA